MSLPTFTAESWRSTERGDIAVVRCDRNCIRDDMSAIFKRVIIDGKEYETKGVESFCTFSYSVGTSMGLLVEKR